MYHHTYPLIVHNTYVYMYLNMHLSCGNNACVMCQERICHVACYHDKVPRQGECKAQGKGKYLKTLDVSRPLMSQDHASQEHASKPVPLCKPINHYLDTNQLMTRHQSSAVCLSLICVWVREWVGACVHVRDDARTCLCVCVCMCVSVHTCTFHFLIPFECVCVSI